MSGSDDAAEPQRPPLFVINGDATPEEIAALTAVLQGLAAAGAEPPARPARSEWAHPRRSL
ncbi:MAG: acyl-CoA carboxylase subunit epsilon, partial [Nocardioidaceae bacterium]|nr:acyl-CoA carboxylase subunit epsilon [Nocardioidaceae bacterium]